MENYRAIFEATCQSWLDKDLEKFLSNLTENIQYSECYGAQYLGKNECASWFSHWFSQADNQVLRWEIHDSYFDGNVAVFTWSFACIYEQERSEFDGLSLVKFDRNRICQISEFEQAARKFRPYKK